MDMEKYATIYRRLEVTWTAAAPSLVSAEIAHWYSHSIEALRASDEDRLPTFL